MKKTLIIIFLIMAIFQMVVLATAIDVGLQNDGITNQSVGNTTLISKYNPANATGKITSVEIWSVAGADAKGVEIAIFYLVSGTNFSTRSTVSVGDLVAGLNTFVVDLDVEEGDYIGIYGTAGAIRVRNLTPTGANWWSIAGDYIPCSDVTFTLSPNTTWGLSLYGTGATVEAGNAIFFGMAF